MMAEGDDDFDGFESAELVHARGVPTAAGEAICERHLARGTWSREPYLWAFLAQHLSSRDDASRDGPSWLEGWLDVVASETVAPAHQIVVDSAIYFGVLAPGIPLETRLRAAGRLVEWLCARAGPGSARTCAKVVRRVLIQARNSRERPHATDIPQTDSAALADCFVPLVRRLVEMGAGELRQQTHAKLMVMIVGVLQRHGPSELFVQAFEITLAAGHEQSAWFYRRPDHEFWRLLEAGLEAGLPAGRVRDVVARTKPHGGPLERVWAPVLLPEVFPLAARVLLEALARGDLPKEVADVGWPAALLSHEPSELDVALSLRTAPQCARIVRERLSMPERTVMEFEVEVEPDVYRPRLARWAEFVVQSVLDTAGPAHSPNARVGAAQILKPVVSWCSNFKEFSPNRANAEALRTWLAAAETEDLAVRIALQLLDTTPSPTHAAAAALECLLTEVPAESLPSRIHEQQLGRLRAEIERFIALPWNEPVFGVDVAGLVADIHAVAFERNPEAEQVVVKAGTLVLEPSYYLEVLRARGGDDAMALCLLYFVHELLHIPQGIGEYETIQHLRETGAETTLMQLDLTADHAALLIVHRATPRWSVTWLERLVFGSLESFPASNFHTHAARHRKGVRLVSTRADLLARERGWDPESRAGYLFADYAPAGDKLFLLSYGPPIRVLAHTTISRDENRVLSAAADRHDDTLGYLAKLDTILTRAFESGLDT